MRDPQLLQLLGPDMKVAPQVVQQTKEQVQNYTLEHLLLRLNQEEDVPAYFAYPSSQQPVPLVLFNHSHGGDFTMGKEELRQSPCYMQKESLFATFMKLGVAVGVIDMWGFGERKNGENDSYKRFLLHGKTLWGQRIYDNQQFLTYLASRKEVKHSAIATLGLSMGGLMSWWLAALDERISVVVDMAAQVDYQALIEEDCLSKHGFYYYVPNVLKDFTTVAIQKQIAPRPRLSLVGKEDRGCPSSGVARLDQQIGQHYEAIGYKEHWQACCLPGGHEETKEMRAKWIEFLKQHLLSS
ncbi:dienelactone hydrolase family protein [Enterococcus casseliflavus]|uniref:dienelactone hydrolase family protein n=1 Tax=Enterococcus casseliflavus TaxID=37734 RepID=UPI00325B836A